MMINNLTNLIDGIEVLLDDKVMNFVDGCSPEEYVESRRSVIGSVLAYIK